MTRAILRELILALPWIALAVGIVWMMSGRVEPAITAPSVEAGEPDPRWCGEWCP